jgi:hypothetical protein
MTKDSFKFHVVWKDSISGLPDEVRLEVYDAVVEYGISGKLSDLKPMAMLAFNFIKAEMDKDKERYCAIVERNRKNGSKSNGRPRLDTPPKKPKKPTGLSGLFDDTKKPVETPVNKGVSEDEPTGFLGFLNDKKEVSFLPPLKETSPITPIENIPPIIPQEKKEKIFKKPTIEEIGNYCREKGYSIDPETFWYFYESKGWMIGKNKMKDWKAACRTWQRQERGKNANTTKLTNNSQEKFKNGVW